MKHVVVKISQVLEFMKSDAFYCCFCLLSLFQCFLNHAFTFDSVQSAQRAKASLNGADIYSGCCTLKIEYAKVVFLYTAYKN